MPVIGHFHYEIWAVEVYPYNNNNISPRLFVCLYVCVFATSFLALAKNAIGVASGESGEARERIGAANPWQMMVCQTKFGQMKFAKWNFANWALPNEVSPNKMFCQINCFAKKKEVWSNEVCQIKLRQVSSKT